MKELKATITNNQITLTDEMLQAIGAVDGDDLLVYIDPVDKTLNVMKDDGMTPYQRLVKKIHDNEDMTPYQKQIADARKAGKVKLEFKWDRIECEEELI